MLTSNTTSTVVTTAPVKRLSSDPGARSVCDEPHDDPGESCVDHRDERGSLADQAVEPAPRSWAIRLVQAPLVVVVARHEIRLEPRRDLEIGVTDAIHAGQEPEVVDPGFDEADVCRHPDEESDRQNEECKRGETVAELGRTSDQGQRNDGRGHDRQKDGGPTEDRAVGDVPRREQAPMLGREDLGTHALGRVGALFVHASGLRRSGEAGFEPATPARDDAPVGVDKQRDDH